MELLVNIKDLFDEDTGHTSVMQKDLFTAIRWEFEEVDKHARIAFADGVVSGSDEPEKLLEIVRGWNASIKENLAKAVEAYSANPDEFSLDSNESHAFSLAARAADDHFSVYGSHGVLMDNGCGYATLSVVLSPGCIQEIEQSPKEWVVITLMAY